MKRTCVLALLCCLSFGSLWANGTTENAKPADTIKVLPNVPVTKTGYALDAEHPYDAPVSGLVHDIEAKGAIYSIYVPEGQQPWRAGVLILTPNGVSAEDFCMSLTGRQWMKVCDDYGINMGVMEPQDGVWNISGDSTMRDDVQAVADVYTQMRSKSQNLPIPFTMDKSRFTVVGYAEGGAMAITAASGFPAAVSGVAAVDATAVDMDYIRALGESNCWPFPADGLKAKDEVALKCGTLPLPIWFIGKGNDAAYDHFVALNHATDYSQNSYASTLSNQEDEVETVWRTVDSTVCKPAVIWREFLSTFTRPLGYEGGMLAHAMQFDTRADGTGYHVTEMTYDGFKRKYLTYVPTTYQEGTPAPMVLVLHGYTATMYALAEESRWCDVAEANGLIVVFAQAYPNVLPGNPNIPCPAWISPNLFQGGSGTTDDMAFLREVIAETKQNYTIDEGRVYGTGHSNGSAMTIALASQYPDLFTAVAPIGYPTAGVGAKGETKVPIWLIVGEFDGRGMSLEEGGYNDQAVVYWTDFNGLEKGAYTDAQSADLRFNTRTWKNASGAPLFKFSGVNRSAHSYFPEESWMVWNEFFSKYRKDGDVLYYDGTEVNDQGLKQIVTKISDHVWCISEFNLVNAFLVEGSEKAALIDTCCGLGNIRAVAESLTDKPIEVLLTHGHLDHTGGIYHFSQDCQIYLNDLDGEMTVKSPMTNAGRLWYVNSRGPVRFPGHLEEMQATVPQTEPDMHFTFTPIHDQDVIDLGGTTLEVITTPGHTDGNVCYLDRKDRILFSGDTLNRSIILARQPNNGTTLIKILNGTMKKIWSYQDAFDCLAVGHDAITSKKSVIQDYLSMTNGLLDGSLSGGYEEHNFRAGDVARQGGAELWYQCDK